jgi:hypothetical protein
MQKDKSNYSSCTGRSSENICTTSGGAQQKGKPDETQFTTKFAGIQRPSLHYSECP